jgi:hypothetical protein
MTWKEIVERDKKCTENGLCFISLNPLNNEGVELFFGRALVVKVLPQYKIEKLLYKN